MRWDQGLVAAQKMRFVTATGLARGANVSNMRKE
jgi:hypothetical protein